MKTMGFKISCLSYSWSGFRPTTRNIGVNISILPDLMSDDAATCKTEWTFVTPLGAMESVSSTVSTQWVTIRPMLDTRKLCMEQPLPSMKEYLWRGRRGERGRKRKRKRGRRREGEGGGREGGRESDLILLDVHSQQV